MISNTSGNVLFIILIAVALFAALSYAVTSSSRGGGSVSKDTVKITSSEILNQAVSLSTAIARLQARGCSLSQDTANEISFEVPPFDNSYGYQNLNAPSDYSCHVYHPNGGGVPYPTVSEEWLDMDFSASILPIGRWYFPNKIRVAYIGKHTCADTSCADLVAMLPFLKEEICQDINERLGITSTGDAVPQQDNGPIPGGAVKFTGDYGLISHDIDNSEHSGQMTGCVQQTANGSSYENAFVFYHILVAR